MRRQHGSGHPEKPASVRRERGRSAFGSAVRDCACADGDGRGRCAPPADAQRGQTERKDPSRRAVPRVDRVD